MSSVSERERSNSIRHGLTVYEGRFIRALATHNAAEAQQILAAVLELLWNLAKGHGQGKQLARNEKMREWNEFNEAVDQALERAQTLETHIRRLSREELRQLRDSEGPTQVHPLIFRISSRLGTEAVQEREEKESEAEAE